MNLIGEGQGKIYRGKLLLGEKRCQEEFPARWPQGEVKNTGLPNSYLKGGLASLPPLIFCG
jgi:hypothetical protein